VKLSYGKRVTHSQYGDGVVVSPRVKGGWTTVRFGPGPGDVRKCDAVFLTERPRTRVQRVAGTSRVARLGNTP